MNGTSAEITPASTPHPFAGLAYTPIECSLVIAYLTVAAVIGTCANSLITAVYLLKKSKCPHEIFMLCVAAINLFGSLFFIPWEIYTVWSDTATCNEPPDYLLFFSMFLECSSALLFLSIAIDRYLAICWATHYLMNPTKAVLMSVGSILLAVILSAFPVLAPTLILVAHLVYPLVLFGVLILIIILYTLVYMTVNAQARKAREQRLKKASMAMTNKQTNNKVPPTRNGTGGIVVVATDDNEITPADPIESDRKLKSKASNNPGTSTSQENKPRHIMEEMRDKTVKILICVTLVYIFCFVPSSIINFVFFASPESFFNTGMFFSQSIKTAQLGYYLNFALNPIVYAALSDRFREDTRVIILKRESRSVREKRLASTCFTKEADA